LIFAEKNDGRSGELFNNVFKRELMDGAGAFNLSF